MYKFKSDILWRIKDKRFHEVIGFGDGVIGHIVENRWFNIADLAKEHFPND